LSFFGDAQLKKAEEGRKGFQSRETLLRPSQWWAFMIEKQQGLLQTRLPGELAFD